MSNPREFNQIFPSDSAFLALLVVSKKSNNIFEKSHFFDNYNYIWNN